MNVFRTAAFGMAVLGLCSTGAVAQAAESVVPDLAGLAGSKAPTTFNRAVTVAREDGRTVVRLDARPGAGGAALPGVQLGEGVIEVDLKGRNVAQQSFLGIAFHWVDWTTFEAVYFRPFNFASADAAARSHAVQYVAEPANTWQRLRAEHPGEYEGALEPPPDPDGWFHARIVVAGPRVSVFVNGAAEPCLSVATLGAAPSGGVALFVGNASDGAFADLRITPTAPPGPVPASTQDVFQAAATGNLVRLRALLEADPQAARAPRPSGVTPLHLAAAYDQRAAAELLVASGADLAAVAAVGGTPADVAAESGRDELVAWLQAHGAALTPVRIDTVVLSPRMRRLAYRWGMMNNVVVLATGEGAVVVDSGFSKRAVGELKKTVAAIAKPGVKVLVNTHLHGDHVAGNAIAPSPGAVITAASLDAGTAGAAVTRAAAPLAGRTGRTLPAPYTLRAGGAELRLIPRPGLHSNADLIVWVPAESVAVMGDLLLSESVPAVDDVAGYLAFLDDVLDVFPEGTTFVSGHGRDLDAAGVRAYRDALTAMIAIVRSNLAAGRTAEQMVQGDVLKEFKPKYSLLGFLTPDAFIPRVAAALADGSLK